MRGGKNNAWKLWAKFLDQFNFYFSLFEDMVEEGDAF